jgi:hypothetical protein
MHITRLSNPATKRIQPSTGYLPHSMDLVVNGEFDEIDQLPLPRKSYDITLCAVSVFSKRNGAATSCFGKSARIDFSGSSTIAQAEIVQASPAEAVGVHLHESA